MIHQRKEKNAKNTKEKCSKIKSKKWNIIFEHSKRSRLIGSSFLNLVYDMPLLRFDYVLFLFDWL